MRNRWWALFVFFGIGASVFAVYRAFTSGTEIATVVLSVPILAVALVTLRYTVPRPAQLTVERLDEAELSDLIFYIYPLPETGGEPQQPADYLLQLHVAVANLGERKAVLSSIRLDGFRNVVGQVVHLPKATQTIGGAQWTQRMGWVDGQFHHENMSDPPPYVLDRDDVIVVRFRARRGIDWSSGWTLESLRTFCEPLQEPIVSAFGTALWRAAGRVITTNFTVPMKVEQQHEYVVLVEALTHNFSVLPDLPERLIQLE